MKILCACRGGHRLLSPLVVSFLLPAGGIARAAQQGPQQPTIRVEVKQVLVPVIVTDRKGHYITNLAAGDFHVFDDGVEQKVISFSTSAGGAAGYFEPQSVELGLRLPERLASSEPLNPAPRSTYLICLDTLNSSFSNFGLIRRALEKLFQGEQASDVQYALLTLGREPRIVQNLTREPAAVLATLDRRELTVAIASSESSNRKEEETELVGMLDRYCRGGCDSGRDPASSRNDPEWRLIEEYAAARAVDRRTLTIDFLKDLQGLCERLGEVPGKRTIIFVSDGFNLQPGRELYGLMAAYTKAPSVLFHNPVRHLEPELQEVLRAAQLRDVSLYTLDSRGVYVLPAAGFEIDQPVRVPSPPRTPERVVSDRQSVAFENQAALEQLAADTGGVFFQNSNELLEGLRRALEDGKAYYLLAYAPASLAADGKFHKIRVEVDQKKAIVRAKKGYWAPGTMQTIPFSPEPLIQGLPQLPTANPPPNSPARVRIPIE